MATRAITTGSGDRCSVGRHGRVAGLLIGAVALTLLLAPNAYGQATAQLVADINPGSAWSGPAGLTQFGNGVVFDATDGVTGREPWASDGTTAGTGLIADIDPGSASSVPGDPWLSYGGYTEINGTVFFRASDGVHGEELWRTDGTAAGTQMVADIAPGDWSSKPSELTDVNGTLFFAANDGVHGEELWKSDGTAAGTQMVADINPNLAPDSGLTERGSFPTDLTNVNGTLFFSAYDGVHGEELWRSDGTVLGTRMVAAINPVDGSRPAEITDLNGVIFFRADDGIHGQELWRSDGTAPGTHIVADINPGQAGSQPATLTGFRGKLYFSADDGVHGHELWRSDGTASGTKLVKDIFPGPGDSGGVPDFNGLREFAAVGRTLFFPASDGAHGDELWKTDGTRPGTVLVDDISPGGHESSPGELTEDNGKLFFAASDDASGREVWESDGTEAGTTLVQDICPGTCSSIPMGMIDVGGTLFFSADDGTHGKELWKLVP